MINLTDEELKHLGDLACINIDDEGKDLFLSKLDSVIGMLDKLNTVDTSDIKEVNGLGNTLRVIPGNKDFPNKKEIIGNVKHDVINNSIVIKSTLSND